MSAAVLVCGSIAEDIIGQSGPTDPAHPATPLTSLNRRWGGCALNVAYGLGQLGIEVIPIATVGGDYAESLQPYLVERGIARTGIRVDPDHTGQATALLIGQQASPQLTFFHAGPSDSAEHARIGQLDDISAVQWVHVAPLAPTTVLTHLQDAKRLGLATLFDPGQCLTRFSTAELKQALSLSDRLTLNIDEWSLLQTRLNLTPEALCRQLSVVILTAGPLAVRLYENSTVQKIETLKVTEHDATGCGDAFRAGYLYGLTRGQCERHAVEFGCCAGAMCLQETGGHAYSLSAAQLESLHLRHYATTSKP